MVTFFKESKKDFYSFVQNCPDKFEKRYANQQRQKQSTHAYLDRVERQ